MIWKDIRGYEGFYQVSSTGQVKSLTRLFTNSSGAKRRYKGSRLKLQYNGHYHHVILRQKGESKTCLIHRLVADAFLGNSSSTYVNHIDGDKLNNDVRNLEWVTAKENTQHAILHGLSPNLTFNNKRSQLIEGVSLKDGSVITFPSMMEAERQGFTQPCISRCVKGIQAHHKGYVWSRTTTI